MKQGLMTTMNNDELQEKWKNCIITTCYAYRTLERVKESINNLYEAIRQLINNLVESFKSFGKSLSLAFEDFKECIEDSYDNEKSFPHSFPHYVDNLKINTKGFPRPITHCARSRC